MIHFNTPELMLVIAIAVVAHIAGVHYERYQARKEQRND